MKRFWCTVLSCCLTFSLVPAVAFARLSTADPLLGEAPARPVTDVVRVLSRDLSTTPRTVPQATDFHEASGVTCGYPVYNENYDTAVKAAVGASGVDAQKAAVRAENEAILDYDRIDASGNLYKGGSLKAAADAATVTRLVRHTAGVGNYGSAVPDSAQAVNKRLSLRMVRYGNVVTGLYAPPGEVVKVTLRATSADGDAKDLGLQAQIGNFSGNAQYADTPANREYVRMPFMNKTLALDSEVNYIGSPLGGAILIYSKNIGGATVEMDIEGAVEMPTYFYGETSDEQLVEQLQAPGPFFAFSTPRGVRVTGPTTLLRSMIDQYGYEATAVKVRRAMEFWDKAFGVSYQFTPNGYCDRSDPDTNLLVENFDPYIPAGSAVNLGWYCICPVGWGQWQLDGDYLVSSGAWGNIHELNHSFRWGGAVDGCVEIENNVISALTYQLYSNIAASRTETGGLPTSSGWNWCADAYNTMQRIRANNAAGTKTDGLEVYVPVQHSFGADAFIGAVNAYKAAGGKEGKLTGNERVTNANVWMYATSAATGYDMGYYMRDVLLFPEKAGEDASATDYLTSPVLDEVRQERPVYIPSGCLYASGFVYGADAGDGEVVEMGRPFRIPYGTPKLLNFNSVDAGGYVSVGNGETVELVGYTQPQHGTLVRMRDPLKFTYTPDADHLDDSFTITLKLTVNDAASSYDGASQQVTYKIALQQDTSASGFTTTFYDYPNTLPATTPATAVAEAAASCIGEKDSDSITMSSIAGFNGAGKETTGRFAVVDGQVYLSQTGVVDLYVRGNVYYNTSVAATAAGLASAADAPSKLTGNIGAAYNRNNENAHLKVYVLAQDESASSVPASDYAAIVRQGEPLYVRAYVVMPAACTCNYRIGYLDGTSVSEFSAADIARRGGTGGLSTPALSDYGAEKIYSYTDPAIATTSLYDFSLAGEPLSAEGAWDLTASADHAVPLSTYGANALGLSVDDDLSTMFHGRVANGTYYEADFIYGLSGEARPFNAIRYKGHANNEYRGKVRDYEVYVGDDLEALKAAGKESPLFVGEGTANQGNDEGVYNVIGLPRAASGKYVRLVARSAYPSNGQYYYAFSDFRVGYLSSIGGEGRIVEGFAASGSWQDDTTFINTRTTPQRTTDGTGTFAFTGTGVIMYSITGAAFGSMAVSIDGGAYETVSLKSVNTRGQQPVYWKSGLVDGAHVVTFKPAVAGVDTINVEYFEVKGAASGDEADDPADRDAVAELTVQLNQTRFYYTGSAIVPAVTVLLGDADVTSECVISYVNNVETGTGTAQVIATFDDGSADGLVATAAFDIVKAPYDKEVTVSFAGGATENRHADAPAPVPQVTGGPDGAVATTFYYAPRVDGFDTATASGTVWDAATMRADALAAGDYYLWARIVSMNYADAISDPLAFKVVHEHVWATPTYEWSADCSEVIARAVCTLDEGHVISRIVPTTYSIAVAPSATTQGTGVFTASFSIGPFTTQVRTVAIPSLQGKRLAVSLDAAGGEVGPAQVDVYVGSAYGELPEPTKQGSQFDGWFTAVEGGSPVSAATLVTLTDDHELHAHWSPVAEVEGAVRSGTVSGGSGELVEGARVELRRGSEVVSTATTDAAGAFVFEAVPYGTYNVVVNALVGGAARTLTIVTDVDDRTVSDAVVNVGDLVIPFAVTDSKLEVAEGVSAIVGGLDTLAEVVRAAQDDAAVAAVSVTMSVAARQSWEAEGADEIREDASAQVAEGRSLDVAYYDVSLSQTVTVGEVVETTPVASALSPLLVAIPLGRVLGEGDEVVVLRYHDGQAGRLVQVDGKATAPEESVDGTFYLDKVNGLACIYASEFSTYAIGYVTAPAHVHDWGDWRVVKEPTEAEGGSEERICLECGAVETRATAPLAPPDGGGTTPGENPSDETDPGDAPSDKPAPGADTPGGTVPDGSAPASPTAGEGVEQPAVREGATYAVEGSMYRVLSASRHIAALHVAKRDPTAMKVPARVSIEGTVYTVRTIDPRAFSKSNVRTVKMASSVRYIRQKAFFKAPKLRRVVVGSGVVSIGARAFSKAPALRGVIVGKSASKIGKRAFAGSKKLKSITVRTAKLTASKVVKSLAGSSVKTVKLKSAATKAKAKYRRVFTEHCVGRAVAVK